MFAMSPWATMSVTENLSRKSLEMPDRLVVRSNTISSAAVGVDG